MPYPLNNATTSAAYTDAATFDTPPTGSASVQVNNAAVYYEVTTEAQGVRQSVYPERYLTPGKWTMEAGLDWREGERLVKLRFRSASTTTAQVTVA